MIVELQFVNVVMDTPVNASMSGTYYDYELHEVFNQTDAVGLREVLVEFARGSGNYTVAVVPVQENGQVISTGTAKTTLPCPPYCMLPGGRTIKLASFDPDKPPADHD
jgi:hypothetical protein